MRLPRFSPEQIPFVVLLVLVFLLPLENAFVDQTLGSITRIVGLAVFPLAVTRLLIVRRTRCLTRPFVLLTAFVCGCLVSRIFMAGEGGANFRMFTLLQLYAMSWVIWELQDSRTHFDWIVGAYLLGAVALALAVMANAASGGPIVKGQLVRVGAFGGNVNRVGVLNGLGIPFLLYLFLRTKRVSGRLVLLGVLPILGYGVLATGSRGAMVACVGCLLPSMIYLGRISPSRAFAALLIGVAGLSLGLVSLPETTRERLLSTGTMVRKGKLNFREDIWDAGMREFYRSPVFGVGVGNYEASVARVLVKGETAHNTFVAVLVETGLLGFALLLLFLGQLAWMGSEDSIYQGLRYSLLIFWVLASLTTGLEGDKMTWFLFGLLGGAGGVRSNRPPATAPERWSPNADEGLVRKVSTPSAPPEP